MQSATNVLSERRLTLIIFITLCFLLAAIFFTTKQVFAGSGLVSSIGEATFVQGAGHFWVTSARPTFSGITTAGNQVSGTVGSQSVTATADASGNWSWAPTSDLSGDNPVTITSGATTATFTLTIGALPENIASASANTLAPAGNTTPTIVFLLFGFILILIGSRGIVRSFSKFD